MCQSALNQLAFGALCMRWAAAGGAVVNNLTSVGGQQMNRVALSVGGCVTAMVINFVKRALIFFCS